MRCNSQSSPMSALTQSRHFVSQSSAAQLLPQAIQPAAANASETTKIRLPHHLPPPPSLRSPCSLSGGQRRHRYLAAASAAAVTWRRRQQQREPVPLRGRARSRRRCWPADAADTRRHNPLLHTSFPSPCLLCRRRRRRRHPAAAPSPGGGAGGLQRRTRTRRRWWPGSRQ
jgi:hypothetical protein